MLLSAVLHVAVAPEKNLVLTNDFGKSFKTCDSPPRLCGFSMQREMCMFFLDLEISTVTSTVTPSVLDRFRPEVRVARLSVACGCGTEENFWAIFGLKNLLLTNDPGRSFKTCDTPPRLCGFSMQREILHVLPGPRDFISYGYSYARLCWTGFGN